METTAKKRIYTGAVQLGSTSGWCNSPIYYKVTVTTEHHAPATGGFFHKGSYKVESPSFEPCRFETPDEAWAAILKDSSKLYVKFDTGHPSCEPRFYSLHGLVPNTPFSSDVSILGISVAELLESNKGCLVTPIRWDLGVKV